MRAFVLGAAALLAIAAAGQRPLPAIVFVSRAPIAGDSAAVPGLGPHQRTHVTPGGRLLVRDANGSIRELLPAGSFCDVSDPSVSPDGRRIAFAATPAPDSAWRICSISIDGSRLETWTRPLPGVAHDIDPCWIGDRSLVFARVLVGVSNTYDGSPVSNLWRLDAGREPVRMTFERNAAEEPAWDGRAGRVLFARWWFNPWRAVGSASGLQQVAPHTPAADSINLWQVMSIDPGGRGEQIVAGDPARRRAGMGYQPAIGADGRVLAVYALNTGLSPAPGRLGIHALDRRAEPGRRLAGALIEADRSSYGSALGLAAPAACSPVVLRDGRVLFSYDPSGRGDFGLWVMARDGSDKRAVLDLPGPCELDAAVLEAWPTHMRRANPAPGASGTTATFRYSNRDVFAGRGAAARIADAHIRFFSATDSTRMIRDVPIGRDGRVDESGLPAHTPMFEQLVDAHGHALSTPRGPAHVAGFNSGAPGAIVRCSGCHVGHSLAMRAN